MERFTAWSAVPSPATHAETGTLGGFFWADAEMGTVYEPLPPCGRARALAAETGTHARGSDARCDAQKRVRPWRGYSRPSRAHAAIERRNGYADGSRQRCSYREVCECPLLMRRTYTWKPWSSTAFCRPRIAAETGTLSPHPIAVSYAEVGTLFTTDQRAGDSQKLVRRRNGYAQARSPVFRTRRRNGYAAGVFLAATGFMRSMRLFICC